MWILIVSILIDQLSKWLVVKYLTGDIHQIIKLIPNILSLEYVENRGAVFGIMQGSNYIMAAISFAVCILLTIYIVKTKKDNKKIHPAWYMILAGGFGNLIDRLIRGYVVDFIATPFIATFNIADSLVVLGVSWLVIQELITSIKNKNKV